jgi:hypothetical protein
MFQPKDKKITIDYQPNRHLIIEYGNYEEHKKYAWQLRYDFFIEIISNSLIFIIPAIFIDVSVSVFISIVLAVFFNLHYNYIISPYFVSLAIYYKIEIRPNEIRKIDLNEIEIFSLPKLFKVEFGGVKEGHILYIDFDNEYCVFAFDCEVGVDEKEIITSSLVELLNIELIGTEKDSYEDFVTSYFYQSKR